MPKRHKGIGESRVDTKTCDKRKDRSGVEPVTTGGRIARQPIPEPMTLPVDASLRWGIWYTTCVQCGGKVMVLVCMVKAEKHQDPIIGTPIICYACQHLPGAH